MERQRIMEEFEIESLKKLSNYAITNKPKEVIKWGSMSRKSLIVKNQHFL